MKAMTILSVICLLLLVGCTQVAGELSSCMDKCNKLCTLAKNSNFTFDGYNSVGLKKQSGGVSVSCNCLCT